MTPKADSREGLLANRLRERLQIRWSAPDKDGAVHQLVGADDLRAAVRVVSAAEFAAVLLRRAMWQEERLGDDLSGVNWQAVAGLMRGDVQRALNALSAVSPTPEQPDPRDGLIAGYRHALERIRAATPSSTNSATAADMASWTNAVAGCALDDPALKAREGM